MIAKTGTHWAAVAAVTFGLLSSSAIAAAPVAPAAPAPAPAAGVAPAAPAGAKPGAAEKTKKTADVLVSQGLDSLFAGDIKAARDCFIDTYQIDPKNRKALEALGFCYLKMNQIPKATQFMEEAIKQPEPPNRALTMNLAWSLLRARNPIRGAKIIRDWMITQTGAPDETALNALAICLGQASDQAKLAKTYQEFVTFYDTYNKKLEDARPGKARRWGLDWISAKEFKVKEDHNNWVKGHVDRIQSDLNKAQTRLTNANAAYQRAYSGNRFAKTKTDLGPLEREIRYAKDDVDDKQKDLNSWIAKYSRATLPSLFDPVPFEDTPTMLASASATPSVTPDVTVKPPATPPTLVKPPTTPPATPPVAPPSTPSVPATPPAVAAVKPPTPPRVSPKPGERRSSFAYDAGFAVAPDLMVTTFAVVDGATRITIQPTSGEMIDAEVVKTDKASGLALLRLKGGRMNPVGLAGAFAGGPIQCAAFPTPAVFEPEAEVLTGSAAAIKDSLTTRLSKHPRLGGAPLLVNGQVVGVEIATRDNTMSELPSASLQQLRALLADQAVPAAAASADPTKAMAVVSAVRSK